MFRSRAIRLAMLLAGAAGLVACSAGQAKTEGRQAPSGFTVGARHYKYSARPFSMGGRVMVPVKETMKALGVKVTGSVQRAGKLSFRYRGRKVVVRDASGSATVGKGRWALERPATRRKGDLFVPASFVKRLDSRYSIGGR